MNNILNYAKLSDNVYDFAENKKDKAQEVLTPGIIGNYSQENLTPDTFQFKSNKWDIEAEVYYDRDNREIVVAFAGTETSSDAFWYGDIASDLTGAIQRYVDEKSDIENFVTSAINNIIQNNGGDDNYELTTVGHSLGGGYAELFAMSYDNPNLNNGINLYTFNALGTDTLIKANPETSHLFDSGNVGTAEHYSDNDDLVSILSPHSVGNHFVVNSDNYFSGILSQEAVTYLSEAGLFDVGYDFISDFISDTPDSNLNEIISELDKLKGALGQSHSILTMINNLENSNIEMNDFNYPHLDVQEFLEFTSDYSTLDESLLYFIIGSQLLSPGFIIRATAFVFLSDASENLRESIPHVIDFFVNKINRGDLLDAIEENYSLENILDDTKAIKTDYVGDLIEFTNDMKSHINNELSNNPDTFLTAQSLVTIVNINNDFETTLDAYLNGTLNINDLRKQGVVIKGFDLDDIEESHNQEIKNVIDRFHNSNTFEFFDLIDNMAETMSSLDSSRSNFLNDISNDFLAIFNYYQKLISDVSYYDGDLEIPTIDIPDPSNLNFVFSRRVRDPLVLDLNGDGITTLGLESNILFDHDGDGFRENTGWINDGDGFLVLDKDLNGTIDNGNELFGDSSIIGYDENNDPIFADQGFHSLSFYDSNNDNIINSNDDIWNDLQIWKDMNSDGYSQEYELFTLSDFDIASINLNYNPNGADAGFGNSYGFTSSFTDIYGVDYEISNFNFTNDQTNGYFNENIEISDEVSDLSQIEGFGLVRDLQSSMELSSSLKEIVMDFNNLDYKKDKIELIDKFLFEWASTSEFNNYYLRNKDAFPNSFTIHNSTTISQLDKVAISEVFAGKELVADGLTNIQPVMFVNINNFYDKLREFAYKSLVYSEIDLQDLNIIKEIKLKQKDVNDFEDLLLDKNDKLQASLMALDFKDLYPEIFGDWKIVEFIKNDLYDNEVLPSDLENLLNQYGEINMSDNEKSFHFNEDSLNNLHFIIKQNIDDFNNLTTKLTANDLDNIIQLDSNPFEVFAGKGDDYVRGDGVRDIFHGEEGNDILGRNYFELGLDEFQYRYMGSPAYSTSLMSLYDYGNHFYGGIGNDQMFGGMYGDYYYFSYGDGKDEIYDNRYGSEVYESIDQIIFDDSIDLYDLDIEHDNTGSLIFSNTTNNDSVMFYGYYLPKNGFLNFYHNLEKVTVGGFEIDINNLKNNTITGKSTPYDVLNGSNENNDIIGTSSHELINAGDGNDTITSSGGYDFLIGGKGNDTYVINNKFEKIKILEKSDEILNGNILKITDDYTVDDVDIVFKEVNNLNILTIIIDGKEIILDSEFYLYPSIEKIIFENDLTEINLYDYYKDEKMFIGDLSQNNISITDNKIFNSTTNEFILNGNGTSDNSSLYFKLGDGKKTVNNFKFVNLIFEDISLSDLALNKENNIITISHNDSIIFVGDNNLEFVNLFDSNNHLSFGDQKIKGTDNNDTLNGKDDSEILFGFAGDDILNGENGDDILIGGLGKDTLNGGDGNDILGGNSALYDTNSNDYLGTTSMESTDIQNQGNTYNGGKGDDILHGSRGGDSYLFALGDGNDTVNDISISGVNDRFVFGYGISVDDISFSIDFSSTNDDLIINYSENDSIRVIDFFNLESSIEVFEFSDGSFLNFQEIHDLIKNNLYEATDGNDSITLSNLFGIKLDAKDGNDTIFGSNLGDTIYGGDGHDTIHSRNNSNDHIDYLYGGNGNDKLFGGNGKDHLIGGSGNDTLGERYWDSRGYWQFSEDWYGDVNHKRYNHLDMGNIYNGGTGSDTMYGTLYRDIYHFSRGDGYDRIYDWYGMTKAPTEEGFKDKLIFDDTVNISDLEFSKSGDNLRIYNYTSGDSIYIMNWYKSGGYSLGYRIEHIIVNDYELTASDFQVINSGNKLSFYNEIKGTTSDDNITGTIGDDKILASAGDDILITSSGNDFMDGSSGLDTFVINENLETLVIQDYFDHNTKKGGIIEFTSHYSKDDINVVFEKEEGGYNSKYHMTINFAGDDKIIRFRNPIYITNFGRLPIENLIFSDGSTIDLNELFLENIGIDVTSDTLNLEEQGYIRSFTGDMVIDGQNKSNNSVIEYRIGDGVKTIKNMNNGTINIFDSDPSKIDYRKENGNCYISYDGQDIIVQENGYSAFNIFINETQHTIYPNIFMDEYSMFNGTDNDDIMVVSDMGYGTVNLGKGDDILNEDPNMAPFMVEYAYKNGDGHDIINLENTMDFRLVFHNNIQDFNVVKINDSVVIEISDTDSITINNVSNFPNIYFQSLNNGENGNILDLISEVKILGTDTNDLLNSSNLDTVFESSLGDDVIYFNPNLNNDIHVDANGHGNDTIRADMLANDDSKEQSLIYENISHENLWFELDGNNLVISEIGDTETLTIENYLITSDKENIDFIKTSDDLMILQRSQIDNIISELAGIAKPLDSLNDLSIEDRTVYDNIINSKWENQ